MAEWRTLVRERLAGMELDPVTVDEVVEEVAQHLEDRYRGLLAGGVPEVEARARSLAEIDGHPRLQRDLTRLKRPLQPPPPTQESSGSGWRAVLEDLQFAWRRLRHAPGFTAMAVVTLALAVGANTAILSFADAVLFRPLPYADPDNVFVLQMAKDRATGGRGGLVPYAFVHAIDGCCESVSDVGLIDDGPSVYVETPEGRHGMATVAVSASYLSILGVSPARGRVFGQGDVPRAGQVALLSYAIWQTRFSADESIVGKTVTFGATSFDVIGVLPPAFVFPSTFAGKPDIVTLSAPPIAGAPGRAVHAVVRVARGATRERAQAELDGATASIAPATVTGPGSLPVLDDVRSVLYRAARPIMRFLLAAAGLVLLIGCANLANMMLVRGRRTARDTAMRLALGASRTRLVRPVIFETLMTAAAGAALAVVMTAALFEALVAQVPPVAYGNAPIGVGGRVVVTSLVGGVGAMLAFSVIPAWRAGRIEILTLLRGGGARGGRSSRLGRPLLAAQVALAVAVVFGAVVAARAFVAVLQTPLGFSPHNVVRVSLGGPRQVFVDALDRLRQRPDVLAAGAVGSIPFSGMNSDVGVQVNSVRSAAAGIQVLPGYFEATGIPLIRGRLLAPQDLQMEPDAAVVSEAAGRMLFGDRDPVGATFEDSRGTRRFRVVGVVGNVRQSLGTSNERPQAYVMPEGVPSFLRGLVVRLRDRRHAALAEIEADLRTVTPKVSNPAWWSDAIADVTAYRNPRFQTLVLGTFAFLALGVTALGIFAVVGHQVVSRTREMGVRLAIGAAPRSLVRLVVGQTIVPVVLGLAGGLVLIHWARGLAEAQLYQVDTRDPWTLATAAAAVLIAALLAAYLPARRATRIDPVAVLRAD